MIKNKEELKDKLYEILDKNNVSHNIFGIKNISKQKGSGERIVLKATSVIDNEDCIYAVQLFLKQDLICIWNYSHNKPFSYSYILMEQRIKKGLYTSDKGKGTHPNEQSIIYFAHTEQFEIILNQILRNIS